MALHPVPIAVTGATHTAQQFRMMIRDLASGAQGVTEGDDLKVTALAVNGSGVQISDGSAVIAGAASPVQGSYSAYNIGADTVPIAATGGTSRSDMVILRVEDPEYEGNRDPAVDPIVFFEVVSNVSSTATAVPAGYSAIPLARIDIPASTATITNAMITDLRRVANPRRERRMYTQSPSGTSALIGGSTTYSYFSTASGWNIPVPTWATKAVVRIDVSPIRYTVNNFWGRLSATFGASRTLQPIYLDDDQGTGTRRISSVVADTLTIPSTYRGTTQLLRVQAAAVESGNLGRISIDGGTTLVADVEFSEDVY